MNVEPNVPGEPQEPDESPGDQPDPREGGTDVFRSGEASVLPIGVDRPPSRVAANESGDAVQGEVRMPDTAPVEPTTFDFDEFYMTYFDRLVVTVRRYCAGDHALAEDVVQMTFLKAYQCCGQLAALRNPYAWLRTAAIRIAQDAFRHEQRRKAREQDRELLSLRADDEWDGRAWTLAIQGLPEPENRVMWLRFVLRYERQAIADELGISLRSVDKHIKRALDRLRRALGGED